MSFEPTLVEVDEFRALESRAFTSNQQVYNAIRTIPDFPSVRIGRRVFIDLDRWRAFKAAGGQALAGGWRKEPR